MKDRPNESQLIAYLYGDLDEREKKEVEEYLKDHPELSQELEEMGSVREMMGKLPDREVLEPTLIISSEKSFMGGFSRTWISIAASLLILILAGFATGFQVKSNGEGWTLGFGGSSDDLFTKSEVEQMLQATADRMDQQLAVKFDGLKDELNTTISQNQQVNQEKIDQAYAQVMKVSETQIASYVEQLDRQQKESIQSYFASSQEQQQVYFNNILTDFADYLENQRKAELENIETYLTSWKNASDQKQMETDQILASIINQVGGQTLSD